VIRVLIVDDSAVLRQQIRFILQTDPALQVVGEARNGEEAISLARQLRPNVITMDLRMPKMDGFGAIRSIMAENPTPIVVISSDATDPHDEMVTQALKMGAVSVLRKPGGITDPGYKAMAGKIIDQVKLMSQVKVVTRSRTLTSPPAEAHPPASVARAVPSQKTELLAIGSSTGGPAALYRVLSGLPASCPVPVVIVQHIALGFISGLASWLAGGCPLQVKVGEHGERLQAGTVYLGADGTHMVVDSYGRIRLRQGETVDGHRPSVTVLFRSVAESYGPSAMGVILTGMGADGASGLKAMRDSGAITIGQDQASCVVFGMPKEAIALGAVKHVVPLDKIARTILDTMIV
jgi:two-component system, chemotaxis family, protein-glutamate methylesterase/glutaminase